MTDGSGKVLRLVIPEERHVIDPGIGAALRRLAERADNGEIDGVLVFSAKGTRGWTHLLGEIGFGSALELWERWKRQALRECEEENPPEPNSL